MASDFAGFVPKYGKFNVVVVFLANNIFINRDIIQHLYLYA